MVLQGSSADPIKFSIVLPRELQGSSNVLQGSVYRSHIAAYSASEGPPRSSKDSLEIPYNFYSVSKGPPMVRQWPSADPIYFSIVLPRLLQGSSNVLQGSCTDPI